MIGDFQVLWKGMKQAPASAIVEQPHLDFWIPHYPDCDCSDCMTDYDE